MKNLISKFESTVLKAHSAALAAGFTTFLAVSKDGDVTRGDWKLVVAAIIGSWAVVYRVPNK